MSQRLDAEQEDPLYLFATSRGLVTQPTIFVNKAEGRLLGSNSFDAYIFWPRFKVEDGRPDWMIRTLNRTPIRIPAPLSSGSGLRLVQARRVGEPASAIPVDQVILETPNDRKVLMLPGGRFWLRTVDRNSKVIAETSLHVKNGVSK
jgi:hypothetical protein